MLKHKSILHFDRYHDEFGLHFYGVLVLAIGGDRFAPFNERTIGGRFLLFTSHDHG